jgi:hypothetical protein
MENAWFVFSPSPGRLYIVQQDLLLTCMRGLHASRQSCGLCVPGRLASEQLGPITVLSRHNFARRRIAGLLADGNSESSKQLGKNLLAWVRQDMLLRFFYSSHALCCSLVVLWIYPFFYETLVCFCRPMIHASQELLVGRT